MFPALYLLPGVLQNYIIRIEFNISFQLFDAECIMTNLFSTRARFSSSPLKERKWKDFSLGDCFNQLESFKGIWLQNSLQNLIFFYHNIFALCSPRLIFSAFNLRFFKNWKAWDANNKAAVSWKSNWLIISFPLGNAIFDQEFFRAYWEVFNSVIWNLKI